MKAKILSIVGIIIAVIGGMWAFQASKQITLQWDAMPAGEKWTEVRIYDTSTLPETLVSTVPCVSAGNCPNATATFVVSRAAHNFTARSWDGFWESADSNAVIINAPPKVPTGLIKK
jgi:hypothetical protein